MSTAESSHRDTVFSAVVARLPVELRDAMLENCLAQPELMLHYPRATLQELGLPEWAGDTAAGY